MGRRSGSATIESSLIHGAPAGLAGRLRHATQALHRAAERSPLMAAVLRGKVDRDRYAALLAQLRPIYQALEDGLDRHAGHPGFAAFGFDALRRAPALAADLQRLGAAEQPLRPATVAYVDRLRRDDERQPPRLVAHAYVRYLGDLHGGQQLARIVDSALGLGAGTLRFHDFGAHVHDAIARFRAALDALPVDAAQSQIVVDEACWSFEQHLHLFDELAP